jgi:hypothetical protein
MDWGLLKRNPRAPLGWAMRAELLITSRKWVYAALCVFNLGLRFVWALSLFGYATSPGGGMFFLEAIEIVRRTVWAIFRIEWEYIVKVRRPPCQRARADALTRRPVGAELRAPRLPQPLSRTVCRAVWACPRHRCCPRRILRCRSHARARPSPCPRAATWRCVQTTTRGARQSSGRAIVRTARGWDDGPAETAVLEYRLAAREEWSERETGGTFV